MSATLLLWLVLQSAPQSQASGAPTPVATWETKDFEARWLAYHAAIAANRNADVEWLKWLTDRKEFDLLALIAICDRNVGAIGFLAQAGAPQWIRVAAWLTHQGDSHTMDSVRKLLLEKDPPRVLGWLQKHRDQLPPNARSIEPQLLKANAQPAPREGDLPPYKPEQVFALLDTPVNQELSELTGERAEPGVRYLHQVLRTIQAFSNSSVREEPWIGRLVKLTRHRDARVRRTSFLAFSHVPGPLIPFREFLTVARSPAEDEDRRAALMAASFSDQPEVWTLLHQIAHDPLDPTWPVAVSRLGDLGNGFTVTWFEQLPPAVARRDAVVTAVQAIRARDAARRVEEQPALAVIFLRRAAWAETVRNPLREALVQWTLAQVRNWLANEAVATQVRDLAQEPGLRDLIRRLDQK